MYFIRLKDIYLSFNALPQETVPTKKALLRYKQASPEVLQNTHQQHQKLGLEHKFSSYRFVPN